MRTPSSNGDRDGQSSFAAKDYDDEQMLLMRSAEFWRMIEKRQASPMIPWHVAKQQLDIAEETGSS